MNRVVIILRFLRKSELNRLYILGNPGVNQGPFADFTTLTSSLSNHHLLSGQPMGSSKPMGASSPMGASNPMGGSKPMGGTTPMGAQQSSFLGSMGSKLTPAAKNPNNLLGGKLFLLVISILRENKHIL